MPDREKVINELNTDVIPFLHHHCDMQCDREKKWISKMIITVHDAIDLLKGKKTANIYKCPYCGTWISAENVVRCKDCRFLIDHYGFMDDGYCRNMRDEHNIKFKPDKDWFCADGERR